MTKQDMVDLEINGERILDCAPSSLVVDVLRNDLRLLGTKKSCKTGACGACTILLDGQPALSCELLAGSASGHSLTTIEGLSGYPEGARLIDAFAFADFPGCGDCVSGFIMSARALLEANPAPDVSEIKLALAGHLCRCVSYEFFVDAVSEASGQAKVDPTSGPPAPQSMRRSLLGNATTIQDAHLPDLVEAEILGSRFARSKVVSVDAARAKVVPGVVAILTAEDFATDAILKLHPSAETSLLATTPSYVGEPIAIVVADTREHAMQARALVDVAYANAPHELRKVDFDCPHEDAHARPRAPPDSLTCRVTRALASSGGSVASWQGNRLTLMTDTEPSQDDRAMLYGASLSGLDETRTDWKATAPAAAARCGISHRDVALAAALSLLLGRPVRVHPHAGSLGFRPAQKLNSSVFTFDDGRIERIEIEVEADVGARPSGFSPSSLQTRSGLRPDLIHKTVQNIASNTPPAVLIDRNCSEVSFCINQSIDAAARRHGMDPLAFRLQQIGNVSISNEVADAAKTFGWYSKCRGRSYESTGRRRPGIGLALAGEETVEADGSAVAVFVEVQVDTDIGTVSLGDCTVLVIAGSGHPSLVRLAAQTGFARGVETALIQEAVAVDDLTAAPATGHYLSRSANTLDIPSVQYIFRDSGSTAELSFQDVAGYVAAAAVGAIANAVRDATGVPPTALPMTVDRLCWS